MNASSTDEVTLYGFPMIVDGYLVGESPTLADYFLLPTLTALSFTAEGTQLLDRCARIRIWMDRMGKLPAVAEFRSSLPPFAPIEHARR